MAVAIAVRQSSPLRWLHRLTRPVRSGRPETSRVATPSPEYAANPDRWALLPGEYDNCSTALACTTLPSITQSGISAPIPCAAVSLTVLHLAGAWHGHVDFEGSVDGYTWRPIALQPLDSEWATTEALGPGIWRTGPHTAARWLRVRATALSAGSIIVAVAGMPGAPAHGWDQAAA